MSSTPSARDAFAHRTLQATIKPGTIVVHNTTATIVFPVAGASQIRVRGKVTGVAIVVKCEFLRPDGVTVYAEGQPDNVNTVDGAEFVLDIAAAGESRMKVSLVGDAALDATVTFIDIMALPTV